MSILRVISRITITSALLLCVALPGGCQQKKESADPWQHLEHYWDGYDPGKHDADSVEQRLVDYMFLTMNAPSPEMRRDCWQTIARIFPDSQPNRTVVEYLGETDSPLYAPAMLEEYLVALTEMFPTGSARRMRVDYLLDGIRKNKPGTRISDLRLVLADGTCSTLHKLIGGSADENGSKNEDEMGGEILVLFYDPECEECSALISALAADGESRHVIAVSVTHEVKKELPAWWVSAKAADADELDANFYLPRLPRLYEVQSDGTLSCV